MALSAILHGTAFAAAGLVLLNPAHVGTQESPVTAEFQVLTDSSSRAESESVEGQSLEHSARESPKDYAAKESLLEGVLSGVDPTVHAPDPLPAAAVPASSKHKVASPSVRSVSHRAATANRGARNIQPDYLKNPPPLYPERSRLAGEQGVVFVRAAVDNAGQVSRVSLDHTSGFPSLDSAAMEAVSQWKFRPAEALSVPMDSEVVVPVRFKLHDVDHGPRPTDS
jgi:TonB family protein